MSSMTKMAGGAAKSATTGSKTDDKMAKFHF